MIRFNVFVLITTLLIHLSVYAKESRAYLKCGENLKSRQLAKLIVEDPKQNRNKLNCNGLLSKIADKKAKEMAQLQRISHIGLRPANIRLIDAGYPLANIYPTFLENNVEAIAGGYSTPEKMWSEFKKSDAHRVHLLAEHEFYLQQNEIGVGYYEDNNTPHAQYWVIYIANRSKEKRHTKNTSNVG